MTKLRPTCETCGSAEVCAVETAQFSRIWNHDEQAWGEADLPDYFDGMESYCNTCDEYRKLTWTEEEA